MSILSDAQILKRVPLPEVRVTIAEKVSQYINDGIFDKGEVEAAFEIIRLMAKDTELMVRKIISEHLKSHPSLPHDIVMSLAQDEDEVSIPILEFCKVLKCDLIEIVRSTKKVAKLSAIARRDGVLSTVTSALIHTHQKEVIITLMENRTAKISGESYAVVIREFKDNNGVINALVHRGGLPVEIAEKMVKVVSGQLKEKLQNDYNLSPGKAKGVIGIAKEIATFGLRRDSSREEDFTIVDSQEKIRLDKAEHLAKILQKDNKLTHSIIIRSLCEGDLDFEASSAITAGIPIINARTLVRDKNPTALESLCKRAKLPLSCTQAIRLIIQYILSEGGKEKYGSKLFRHNLLEYIESNGLEKTVPLMPYIIALISSNLDIADFAKQRN